MKHSSQCPHIYFTGKRPEDFRKPADGPGVLGQGKVVQHPGSRLEPADPPACHRPPCPPPRPPRHF